MQKKYFISLVISTLVFLTSEYSFAQDSLFNLLKSSNKDTQRVSLLNKIAIVYNFNSNDSALKYANLAIQLSKTLSYPKGEADAYVQIGNYYGNFSVFDSSLLYYDKALKIRIEANDTQGQIKVMINKGMDLHTQGLGEIAKDIFKKAYNLSYKINDVSCKISSCENLGAIEQDLGNFVAAMKYYNKSLALNDSIGDKNGVAISYNNIGTLHNLQGNYREALNYFNKNLEINAILSNRENKALAHNNIGMVYISLNDEKNALLNLLSAHKYYIDLSDKINAAATLLNIGFLKESIQQNDSALLYYNSALSVFKQENYKLGMVLVLNNIAHVMNKLKQPKSAIEKAMNALEIATQSGFKDDIKESYRNLFESYELMKDYLQTYKYYRLFRDVNDSIYNIENTKKLTTLEMQYEIDKNQKLHDIEQKQKEEVLEKQRYLIFFVIIGMVLMTVVAIQFFRSKIVEHKANQKLTEQNLRITEQKELIEIQHSELEHHHTIVLNQKEEITSSIIYAKRIQTALLPTEDSFKIAKVEYFIFFKPLSIVSGDFYWVAVKDNLLFTAVADCTGHGVPGAFMSMLGISFINEIVNQMNIYSADNILNQLRVSIILSLKQTGKEGESKDGMDLSFTILNLDTLEMQYAGAYNPLYIYRNHELIQVKADRMPIGIHLKMGDFTNNILQMQKGDIYYLFSDGYHDQIGGNGNETKKLMTKGFQRILQSIHLKSMDEQKQILDDEIIKWLGVNEQIDDITVLGVRI